MALPIAYQTLYNISRGIMNLGRNGRGPKTADIKISETRREPTESTAQATYLLPRWLQKIIFLQNGYYEGDTKDNILVRKAVGDRYIPVYQTDLDKKSRDELTVIGNTNSSSSIEYPIHPQSRLTHAGYYPSALYIDADGNLYRKDWDLNDYGDSIGTAGTKYQDKQWQANFIDIIGSPVVVTTGFQPVYQRDRWKRTNQSDYTKQQNIYDNYEESPIIQDFIKNSGLIPYYEDIEYNYGEHDKEIKDSFKEMGIPIPTTKKLTMFTLPEIVVIPKRKKGGKLIPKKRFIK